MSFLGHLEELRVRLARAGLVVVILMAFFLSFQVQLEPIGEWALPVPTPSLYGTMAASVYRWVADVAVPPQVALIVTAPAEAFAAQMGIALLLGLLVGSPFVGYEVWAFLSPGLTRGERRFFLALVPIFIVLFVMGGIFGFLAVAPMMLGILYGFADPVGATPFLSASSLVGTVLTMTFVFGLAFELPLVMAALVRMGIMEPHAFVRKWRHAVIAIFVAGALATADPTLTSQVLVSVLLSILYVAGIVAGFAVERRAPRELGRT